MRLAVVLSGFACYQQVDPTELDRNVRPPEECEMRTQRPAERIVFEIAPFPGNMTCHF